MFLRFVLIVSTKPDARHASIQCAEEITFGFLILISSDPTARIGSKETLLNPTQEV